MTGFDAAIALSPDGTGFTGSLDRAWWGGVGPHGGYLAAIIAEAALRSSEPRQQIRSLTTHYLQPGREGPFRVHVERLRSTRSATTMQLTIHQEDEVVIAGIAALVRGRSCPELEEGAMPAVTAYEDTDPYTLLMDPNVSDVVPPFSTNVEYRHCLGPAPLSGASEALTGGWMRFADRRRIDVPGAAMLMDAWWPAVWSRLRQVPRTPTVDLTLHFRRPLPGTDEALLALYRSRLGVDGFVDEEGELWSSDGHLLVQSRQLAVLLAAPDAISQA